MSSQTVEARTITIEAVNPKPKYPKFSAGSLLVDGKWISVNKKLNMRDFQKGNTIDVDIETNEKGYESVVGINQLPEQTKAVEYHTSDTKDQRIARQGAIQAGYISVGLSGLSGETMDLEARRIAENILAFSQNA